MARGQAAVAEWGETGMQIDDDGRLMMHDVSVACCVTRRECREITDLRL